MDHASRNARNLLASMMPDAPQPVVTAHFGVGKLLTKATDLEGHALTLTAAGPASAQGGAAVLQGGSILCTPANDIQRLHRHS